MDKVTQAEVDHIQQLMNQRPQKLLAFKTPEEVYTEIEKVA